MAAKRKGRGTSGDGTPRLSGEFRGKGPVRTCLYRGNTFAARSLKYVELDGMAVFEGDIILGTVEEVERMSKEVSADMASGVAAGVIISGAQFRWPNCRVPFTIDATLPDQARVTNAIAHWESRTNFRFVARTTETDFVTFRPGGGCSAHVGRRGGQQFVNLAAGCDLGRTIHEIGHVVGLWHEQSREDRDLFVTINFANIISGMEHNFDQHITDGDDVGAYDFGSIMHYPRDAFTRNGLDTIVPRVPLPPGVVMGQRVALSAGDIAAAQAICGAKPLKEGPKDPIKETIKDIRKEPIKDGIKDFETRKELIKDIRFDTRKELIRDTFKEQVRDTVKEGAFDPGPKLADPIITPGRPHVVQPGPVTPGAVGARPFAVVTPQPGAQSAEVAGELQKNIEQLDEQLQQLAEQLAQAEAARASLQSQYDETAALLNQLMQHHDQGIG